MTTAKNNPEQLYRFDNFVLDTGRGALQRDGQDVKLRPKSFELLHYLVRNHGQLMAKEELLDAIWGSVVVTDDAVTQCVIDIRRALGDKEQAMLRTVPRRGYIFDVPVVLADRPAPALSDQPQPRWRRWLIVATVALLAAGIAYWWPTSPDDESASPLSIAVLPFLDLSPEKDQEYFAQGISEELLNLLARIPELRVIARTSSFTFSSDSADVTAIADQLKVSHILEGSVRKSGNQLRVTVQLVETRTSAHLWSETYDRELIDVFAIQDEIAADVVDRLKLSLGAPIRQARTTDPEAFRLYLEAKHLLDTLNFDHTDAAESLLRDALALDDQYVPAWRELGRALWRGIQDAKDPTQQIRESRNTLDKALAIDPNDATTLAYYAYHVADFQNDIRQAAMRFERAFALEPANEDVIRTAMLFSRAFASHEDVVALGEFGVSNNPLCLPCYANLGSAYRNAGRLDEAIATFARAFTLFQKGSFDQAIALLLNGEPEAALEIFETMQHAPLRHWGRAVALHDLGQLAASADAVRAIADEDRFNPWAVAGMYAWTGRHDQAFDELEVAARQSQIRHGGEIVRYNPVLFSLEARHGLFTRLHDDPRWQQFLVRHQIPTHPLGHDEFHLQIPSRAKETEL